MTEIKSCILDFGRDLDYAKYQRCVKNEQSSSGKTNKQAVSKMTIRKEPWNFTASKQCKGYNVRVNTIIDSYSPVDFSNQQGFEVYFSKFDDDGKPAGSVFMRVRDSYYMTNTSQGAQDVTMYFYKPDGSLGYYIHADSLYKAHDNEKAHVIMATVRDGKAHISTAEEEAVFLSTLKTMLKPDGCDSIKDPVLSDGQKKAIGIMITVLESPRVQINVEKGSEK